MMNKENLENLPYGPLTLEAHDRLSNSAYDASQGKLHKIAKERGVELGATSRRRFTEAIEQRRRELGHTSLSTGLYSVDESDPAEK